MAFKAGLLALNMDMNMLAGMALSAEHQRCTKSKS